MFLYTLFFIIITNDSNSENHKYLSKNAEVACSILGTKLQFINFGNNRAIATCTSDIKISIKENSKFQYLKDAVLFCNKYSSNIVSLDNRLGYTIVICSNGYTKEVKRN